jgi:hypothetical protein
MIASEQPGRTLPVRVSVTPVQEQAYHRLD